MSAQEEYTSICPCTLSKTDHWPFKMMQVCVQQIDVVKLTSFWLCWPVLLATEILTQTGEQERYTFDRSVVSTAFFPCRQRGSIWLLEKSTHFSCSSPDVFATVHISSLSIDQG
jgi:hypothetical protein